MFHCWLDLCIRRRLPVFTVMMKSLVFYCRAGFETDLSDEICAKSAEMGVYGYPKYTKHSGFIEFVCHQQSDAELLIKKLVFSNLVFARQMFLSAPLIEDLDTQDRIAALVEVAHSFPLCGDIRVEYPDTTEGRELSKFCRKFTVPLRQTLRKQNLITSKEMKNKPVLHAFFLNGSEVYLGYSFTFNNNPNPLGILRLKFPTNAPSRSTLKLDEGFQTFIPTNERAKRLAAGMHAVDLGACPGGWTYQLVIRGMFVQAIDNGAMDQALMDTGQVRYFAEDGFKYQPSKKNVYWLVCDMIEQPQKVARLMAKWIVNEWCKEALFNLKLPMKQRYESVKKAIQEIDEVLSKQQLNYQLQAKHLYHDREEITVHLRLL